MRRWFLKSSQTFFDIQIILPGIIKTELEKLIKSISQNVFLSLRVLRAEGMTSAGEPKKQGSKAVKSRPCLRGWVSETPSLDGLRLFSVVFWVKWVQSWFFLPTLLYQNKRVGQGLGWNPNSGAAAALSVYSLQLKAESKSLSGSRTTQTDWSKPHGNKKRFKSCPVPSIRRRAPSRWSEG